MEPRTQRRPGRGELVGDGLSWLAHWSSRLVLVALGLALVGYVIGQLWAIVFPVFLGLIIATVLEPPVTRLRGRGVPSTLAALLVVVGVVAVLGGVGALLVPQVVDQLPQLVQAASGGIDRAEAWLAGPPFDLGAGQIGQAVQQLTQRLQDSAAAIVAQVFTGVTAIADGLVTLVLAVVLAFLFVKDGHRFLPWVDRMSGHTAGPHLTEVSRRAWGRLGGFIRSQAIIGFADAAVIGTGLALLGIPLALPLTVLTFFGAFIPIIGSLVAGTLAVLIALLVKGFTTALFVLILILAVQQIEGNLLQPLVQGRGLGLHAAVVILAVTAGSSLAGVAGAFLSVPVAAVVAEVVRYLNEQIDGRARSTESPSSSPSVAAGGDDLPAPRWRARWRRRRRSRRADPEESAAGAPSDGPDGADPDGARPAATEGSPTPADPATR